MPDSLSIPSAPAAPAAPSSPAAPSGPAGVAPGGTPGAPDATPEVLDLEEIAKSFAGKRVRFKANGRDVEFDAKDLTRNVSQTAAAQAALRDRAEAMKQLEQLQARDKQWSQVEENLTALAEAAKEDPSAADAILQALGLDPERYTTARQKAAAMRAKQRELEAQSPELAEARARLEAERQAFLQEQQRLVRERQMTEEQAAVQAESQRLEQTLISINEAAGLPRDARAVALVGMTYAAAMQSGKPVDLKRVASDARSFFLEWAKGELAKEGGATSPGPRETGPQVAPTTPAQRPGAPAPTPGKRSSFYDLARGIISSGDGS